MSTSVAKDLVIAQFSGKESTIYTYCPNTAIVYFFKIAYPEIEEATFWLAKHVHGNFGENTYVRHALGTFKRALVLEAMKKGEAVAQIITFPSAHQEIQKKVAQKEVTGSEPLTGKSTNTGVPTFNGLTAAKRVVVLAGTDHMTKEVALPILVQEYPQLSEKNLKTVMHSNWARGRKEAGLVGPQ